MKINIIVLLETIDKKVWWIIMDETIICKSCRAVISDSIDICPTCHIKSPKKMSAKKKKTFFLTLVIGIIIIVIVPMVASLLWMQSK